jgi:hypothetical protein
MGELTQSINCGPFGFNNALKQQPLPHCAGIGLEFFGVAACWKKEN